MKEYLDMVKYVLDNGVRKKNRTGVDTISTFSYFYKVDLSKGYPLLTTKKVYFNSMLKELFWYLSGDEHIKELRKHTKIWDAWADEEGRLETAYGRFWRKYPVPKENHFNGEVWVDKDNKWTTEHQDGTLTFDQIQYIIDTLKEIKINPEASNGRRLIVSAWHPGNATISKLPPCHYTFAFNVQGDKLNCHLTQRSGDVALGIPFNLACYSLLTMMIAKECGYKVGEFAHTIIDCHIYENHIEGLKEQIKRTPKELPEIKIADKPFNELTPEDIELINYNHDPLIKFEVAV
ncbi:thymidylate synthase [Hypnocyclicus thermotrophus]|uniref:Thymidylate synthase n=1 Tax=Hypnocyclicus thermotrophus TaxID=1627895 RepID=A0AA46DZE5_9FUSO|nr:thymidylate synthase [Hypnocyclicus thermotrophus]TDT71813.1 thymidylate synthase [Hypnocyclicus thermotrophus]